MREEIWQIMLCGQFGQTFMKNKFNNSFWIRFSQFFKNKIEFFLVMYHIIFIIGIDIIHFYVDVISNLVFPLILHFTLIYITFEDKNLSFFFWIFLCIFSIHFPKKIWNCPIQICKAYFLKIHQRLDFELFEELKRTGFLTLNIMIL